MAIRSERTKAEFIQYVKDHPEQRFWQCVRNFVGTGTIAVGLSKKFDFEKGAYVDFEDTFNWEGRDK